MKEIKRERISSGYFKIDKITYRNKNGKEFPLELMERGQAVCGMLYNSDNDKYVFTRQFRPGANNYIIECIAGMKDKHEEPEDTFCREVTEETGYVVTSCTEIMCGYASPGGTTEKIHVFNGITNGHRIGTGGGLEEENEDIEVLEFSRAEIMDNINLFSQDLKTYIGVTHVLNSLLATKD
jgi:ADP-ribose pyrophosphatase